VTPSQPPLALTRRRQLQLVIVPALELALGFDIPAAVGTSLLVIAINSAAALISRLGGTPISTGRCSAVHRYRDRGVDRWQPRSRPVSATRLTVGFVVLLVAVASYTAVRCPPAWSVAAHIARRRPSRRHPAHVLVAGAGSADVRITGKPRRE